MRTKQPKVVVVQDEANPVEKSVLAKAIIDISMAAKKLTSAGINRKGIVVLLSHSTKLPQTIVKAVLDGMEELQETYLSKP